MLNKLEEDYPGGCRKNLSLLIFQQKAQFKQTQFKGSITHKSFFLESCQEYPILT